MRLPFAETGAIHSNARHRRLFVVMQFYLKELYAIKKKKKDILASLVSVRNRKVSPVVSPARCCSVISNEEYVALKSVPVYISEPHTCSETGRKTESHVHSGYSCSALLAFTATRTHTVNVVNCLFYNRPDNRMMKSRAMAEMIDNQPNLLQHRVDINLNYYPT